MTWINQSRPSIHPENLKSYNRVVELLLDNMVKVDMLSCFLYSTCVNVNLMLSHHHVITISHIFLSILLLFCCNKEVLGKKNISFTLAKYEIYRKWSYIMGLVPIFIEGIQSAIQTCKMCPRHVALCNDLAWVWLLDVLQHSSRMFSGLRGIWAYIYIYIYIY